VYDGSAQSVEIKPNFNEEYRFFWSLTKGDETSYSETAPTLRNVADGELTVYFKFETENYEPYYGKVIFRILPKTLTDEMVVLTDEAFFYDPGSTVKKPSVTVSDTNAVGVVISTVDDYTVVYDEATSAGAIPVTVTGKNNYTGIVTKTFDVLKRPVAPPVIGSKSYNAKNQTATIPVDERWMVVKNDGGINASEYEVILRLTNSNDYMWKGTDGKSADWTGVFVITRGANGWSRYPGIANWTEGDTPSEPVMGTPRRGTTAYVTYRKRGADVSTAVREQPTRAGKYTARFVVEESENYVGTYRDVDFEILPGVGGFTETQTTPVPVPYDWLEKYLAKYGEGDYEKAGKAKGRNGCFLWESYVAGLDPDDATSKFTAKIEMGADGKAVVTWSPDLSKAEKPRKYTTLGKEKLGDEAWSPVTDDNKAKMRFFKVTVEMK
jgi:effector-binding domain-containing protein